MTGAPLRPDNEPSAATQPAAGAAQPPAESSAFTEVPSPAVPGTRTGLVWWALGLGMLLLIVVLVFVLQNLSAATTNFFTVKWSIPLGLDLLLAALLGGVITFLLGAARMFQIRRVARRYARTQRG